PPLLVFSTSSPGVQYLLSRGSVPPLPGFSTSSPGVQYLADPGISSLSSPVLLTSALIL
ncbi:hypothetical protein NDU88_005232, partial [Pleurodeles waltl]